MITVNAGELLALLQDGAESHGTDESLPMLMGTLLHVDQGRLYATSTDRFSLVQTWAPLSNDEDTEEPEDALGSAVAVIPPAGVRMLLQLLKSPASLGVADVAASDEFATLRVTLRYEGAGATVPLMPVEFPHVGRLFDELDQTRNSGEGNVALSPKLLARIVAIAKRRRAHVRFEFGQANKVTVAHVGDQCRILCMPLRLHDEVGPWRWSTPPRPVKTLRSVKS